MVTYLRGPLEMISAYSPPSGDRASRLAAGFGVERSQESTIPPFQIGAPFPNEIAFEMVGRTERLESSITAYGFLVVVAGLDRPSVFVEPADRSAMSARFTYFAHFNQLEDSTPGGVPVTNAEGTLTIYFSENGGSDPESMESFFQGDPIATSEIHLEEVRFEEQQEPGVVIGEGTLTQVVSAPFSLDGEDFRFGFAGLEERFLYFGSPVEEAANLTSSIAGKVTVSRPQATPVAPTGTPESEGSGDSTPSAEQTSVLDASCVDVEPWLQQSLANADLAEAIVGGIPASASVQSLDLAAVSDAATDLEELVETQRALAVPDVAISANRLLVTSLGTFSRGAALAGQAVAEGDGDTLSAALDIIADGQDLAARARDQLDEIATTCGLQT